jgi:hypothetical protein
MCVHLFCQYNNTRHANRGSWLRGALFCAVALGFAASAQAAPLVLEEAAIKFSDTQRSPYSLVPSSYSGDGEGEVTVTKSGTYKLDARDGSSFGTSSTQALKIPVGGGKNYWIAYRKAMPDTETPLNGVLLYWIKDNTSDAQLLDTTPGTPAGVDDAALSLGSTFADKAAGLYITPTRRVGSSSIEVVVNMGKFEANKPPTVKLTPSVNKGVTGKDLSFSVEASDPDRDTLAYYWDFNDGERQGGLAATSATVKHSWEKSADYRVRCTVSDMKGGTASASFVLRIQRLPGIEDVSGRHRISGTVTQDGQPFADALVRVEAVGTIGKSAVIGTAFTDSDGTFALLNILPGNYIVKADKPGYTIEPIRISTNRTPETVYMGKNDVTDVPFNATPK